MIMNLEQAHDQSTTETTPDMTVKSGKTTYLLNFHFSDKGKQTMNDKVFKLILTDYAKKTNSVH